MTDPPPASRHDRPHVWSSLGVKPPRRPGPGGATINFVRSAHATTMIRPLLVSCDQSSGSHIGDRHYTVSCTATDNSEQQLASGVFTVTVATRRILFFRQSPSPAIDAEATVRLSGASVRYSVPTAIRQGRSGVGRRELRPDLRLDLPGSYDHRQLQRHGFALEHRQAQVIQGQRCRTQPARRSTHVPADIAADATSPSGCRGGVWNSVGNRSRYQCIGSCSPASGSTFPVVLRPSRAPRTTDEVTRRPHSST